MDNSIQQHKPPDTTEQAGTARRRFLHKLGIISVASVTGSFTLTELKPATAALAPATTDTQAVTDKRRWGLLIDSTKCTSGCDACVRGCNEEHGISGNGNDDTEAQWIRKVDLKDNLTGQASSLPVMCQHCDSAPCVDVCPTGASFKRADGVVLVNKHTCIGCRYCVMACPYKARSFIHETLTKQKSWAPRGKGTVESCTLCVHRIDSSVNGQINDQIDGPTKNTAQPACAVACTDEAHSAIVFGDLNDPDSEISQLMAQNGATAIRADLELGTGVRYTRI